MILLHILLHILDQFLLYRQNSTDLRLGRYMGVGDDDVLFRVSSWMNKIVIATIKKVLGNILSNLLKLTTFMRH
jgi:hypothetical protein